MFLDLGLGVENPRTGSKPTSLIASFKCLLSTFSSAETALDRSLLIPETFHRDKAD